MTVEHPTLDETKLAARVIAVSVGKWFFYGGIGLSIIAPCVAGITVGGAILLLLGGKATELVGKRWALSKADTMDSEFATKVSTAKTGFFKDYNRDTVRDARHILMNTLPARRA